MDRPLSFRVYKGLQKLKRVGRRLIGRRPPGTPGNDNIALYGFLVGKQQPSGASAGDDFQWDLYNLNYRGEMEELAREFTLRLGPSDADYTDGRLRIRAPKPLHPNWRLLYETILQLQPASLLELGCGNGMHLANLTTLMPPLEAHGVDRSAGQIEFLGEINPDLADCIVQLDATLPFPADTPAVDVAFTQALLMHIQGGNRHLEALENPFRIARPDLHCYYRESEEYRHPHLLVCSSVSLDYPELQDYQLLLIDPATENGQV